MSALVHEKIWLDKNIYGDAERNYYESLSKVCMYYQLACNIFHTLIITIYCFEVDKTLC